VQIRGYAATTPFREHKEQVSSGDFLAGTRKLDEAQLTRGALGLRTATFLRDNKQDAKIAARLPEEVRKVLAAIDEVGGSAGYRKALAYAGLTTHLENIGRLMLRACGTKVIGRDGRPHYTGVNIHAAREVAQRIGVRDPGAFVTGLQNNCRDLKVLHENAQSIPSWWSDDDNYEESRKGVESSRSAQFSVDQTRVEIGKMVVDAIAPVVDSGAARGAREKATRPNREQTGV
jgi:hypothetical protein